MRQARRFVAMVARAALRGRQSCQPGQGMAEYGLILAGVAAVVIVTMDRFDRAVGALFNRVASSL